MSRKMKRVGTATARDKLKETIERVVRGKERVVIRRGGKRVAAVVPLEDLRLLEELEDRFLAQEARKVLADPQTEWVPWEQVKRRLGR